MSTATAVLLVAGMGTRLGELTADRPKALVDVCGETILGRAVKTLVAHGVRKFVLATGYRQDAIEEAMKSFDVECIVVPNPRFSSTQNSVSLALCADAVGGDAFFKLDGDVLFDEEVLRRLDACPAPLATAVDHLRELDEEAMKVSVSGKAITAFGKHLPVRGSAGESIGIERLSAAAGQVVFQELARQIENGVTDRYYEDVYSDLIAEGLLEAMAVPVGDLPWTEVDDQADLDKARQMVTRSSHTSLG